MTLKLYNTASRTIETFKPYNENIVKMYTCGPTVYHYAHIGNMRTYIMEDVLEKTLTYLGYNVQRAMNITDVGHLSGDSDSGEDKMLNGAKREHKTVMEIAKFYTDVFKEDCKKLNIAWPKIVVPATSCIDEYIKLVDGLMQKGFAYFAGGNVYFDVSKLKDYYILTNHTSDDMFVGVREGVDADANKKNMGDFVLWFTKSKFEDQELKWDSPWGYGYPGWHIECSAISLKYLGENLDIHCGGVDNIFPHHTNEIAQTESYLGHKWCSYWFHSQHLNVENGKMSKSSGEFLTVDTLIKRGYSPIAYRMYCLQSHYRNPLMFSFERLDGTQNAYNKLISKIKNIRNDNLPLQNDFIKIYQEKFKDALSNDINTSLALTTLYDVIKDEQLNNATKLYLIKDFDKVLSLNLILDETIIDQELEKFINQKIKERNQAKKDKNFEKADQIRNELLQKGILLKDTREGTEFYIQ